MSPQPARAATRRDWEKGWECTTVYEGHAHYVMMCKFNPKDSNTFASASLDRSIKVWGIGGATPHFSLDGHERGVNCVDYYPGGDKPYLMRTACDKTTKIGASQPTACLQHLAASVPLLSHGTLLSERADARLSVSASRPGRLARR